MCNTCWQPIVDELAGEYRQASWWSVICALLGNKLFLFVGWCFALLGVRRLILGDQRFAPFGDQFTIDRLLLAGLTQKEKKPGTSSIEKLILEKIN